MNLDNGKLGFTMKTQVSCRANGQSSQTCVKPSVKHKVLCLFTSRREGAESPLASDVAIQHIDASLMSDTLS